MSRQTPKTLTKSVAPQWNALTSPWMEAMGVDARPRAVSALDALRDSANLHQIVSPNPLDLFAAHRFLLTLLYWQSADCGGVEKLRRSLLAGRMPRAVIQGLRAEEGCFDLFDTKKPFMQDASARERKSLSPASLFGEMASGTNIAHFHHGDDDRARLCLRCATLGLLRLIPWTPSDGQGKAPSLHGAQAIMVLAQGETLCHTLGLNLVTPVAALGHPKWSGTFTPTPRPGSLRLLEALTWNPRRVHLREPNCHGHCWLCGDTSTPTVGGISFGGNPHCVGKKEHSQAWRDPAVFYWADGRTCRTTNEHDAAIGRDVAVLFPRESGKHGSPPPEAAVVRVNPGHDDWLLILPCSARKAAHNKSFDHRIERLANIGGPTPARAKHWSDELPWEADDRRLLRPPHVGQPSKGMHRFASAAALLDAACWSVLSNAAGRGLNEDPAAFDIFTGIYWPLRDKDNSLPSRAAAWMALKLMATAGDLRPQPGRSHGSFQPWADLNPAGSPAKKKVYRRSIPAGLRLESELREIIRRAANRPTGMRIDWPGLCQFLNDFSA